MVALFLICGMEMNEIIEKWGQVSGWSKDEQNVVCTWNFPGRNITMDLSSMSRPIPKHLYFSHVYYVWWLIGMNVLSSTDRRCFVVSYYFVSQNEWVIWYVPIYLWRLPISMYDICGILAKSWKSKVGLITSVCIWYDVGVSGYSFQYFIWDSYKFSWFDVCQFDIKFLFPGAIGYICVLPWIQVWFMTNMNFWRTYRYHFMQGNKVSGSLDKIIMPFLNYLSL